MAFLSFLAPVFKGISAIAGASMNTLGGNVAAAALTGLADNKRAKLERAQALSDVDNQFIRLRDAAEAAGFNPLTVLGAAPNSGMPTHTVPALGAGALITRAMGDGLQTWFNQNAGRDPEKEYLEKRLLRAEAAKLEAQGRVAAGGYGYDVTGGGLGSSGSGAGGNGERDIQLSRHADWRVDPDVSPAQKIEDEYGDAVSWGYGVGKLAWDLGYNVGTRLRERYGPNVTAINKPALSGGNVRSNSNIPRITVTGTP